MAAKLDPLYLAAASLLGAARLSACASTGAPMRPVIQAPWRPGNADAFQAWATEERGARTGTASFR
jgi:hypothetical protein